MRETVHRHHEHDGHDHHSHTEITTIPKKTSMGRFMDGQRARQETRFERSIFTRALTVAQSNQILPEQMHQERELSPEMRDRIVAIAKRTGKEKTLLDPTLSDKQLENFSQAFSHLHTHRPVTSQLFQWTLVGGQFVIAAAEGITAGSSSAILVDVGHNIGDGIVYGEQTSNARTPESKKATNHRRRKAMYTVLSATSAILGLKAGSDIVLDQDGASDPLAIYTAGASVAFNGGIGLARFNTMRRRRRQGGEINHHDHDLNKHLLYDSASAGLAFVGALAESSMLGLVAGVVSGAIGASYFFPSEENLQHSYHAHGDQEEHHHEEKAQKPKPKRTLRRVIAGVAATAALATGLVAGDTIFSNFQEHKTTPQQTPATAPQQPELSLPETKPPESVSLTECVIAKKGNSQWRIAQRQIVAATGERATDAATYAVTIVASDATKTTSPNPDAINTNECVQVPTIAATNVINEAITNPNTIEQELRTDLQTLDAEPTIIKALKQQNILQRIRSRIVQKLTKKTAP